MKTITKFLLFLLLPLFSFSQEYTYIDFGSPNTGYTSDGNWNNITNTLNNETGITKALINFSGVATGVTLTVDDPFDTFNTAGTTAPDASLPFPSTATRDSFFGETTAFNGNTQPTGGFVLSGLDPAKFYSFSIFASRTSVTDNREAKYTLVGATTQITSLNASNNTTQTTTISDLKPNASGEIKFTAQPGANNTNTSGFYYLGAVEMIASSTSLSSDKFQLKKMLSLYPNPIDDHFTIALNLENDANLVIDIYDINGKLIQNLFQGKHDSGTFNYTWENGVNNSRLVSGIYLLKININGNSYTEKLLVK